MKEMMAKAKKDKEDANKRGEFPIDKKELADAQDIWKRGAALAEKKFREKQAGIDTTAQNNEEDKNEEIIGDEEMQKKLE